MKTPLGFYGGKFLLARWIARQLPIRGGYFEPFAGMASVLLARPPSRVEMLVDANPAVCDWWRVMQDPATRAQLIDRLEWTGLDDATYLRALDAWSHDDLVMRAWAFAVCAMRQIAFGGTLREASARRAQYVKSTVTGKSVARRIIALRDRLAHVQIINADAKETLERVTGHQENVIYLDPPYRGAHTARYHTQTTIDDFVDLLVDQPACIALSGPGHPALDDDGWTCHTIPHAVTASAKHRETISEFLWLNRRCDGQRALW